MKKIKRTSLNPVFAAQVDSYCAFVDEAVTKNAVSRRFFISVPCNAKTEEDARAWLSEKKALLEESLSRCGNTLKRPDNPARFTAEVLYTFLNRGTAERQSLPQNPGRTPATRREIKKVSAKADALQIIQDIEPEMSPWLSYVFPPALDATRFDYIVCGDSMVSCYMAVNYQYSVNAAWLTEIVGAGEGLELSLFFYPLRISSAS
ncbi:hypothetical protein FACS1894217_15170 [Clostridia bacterium]|nr:hypothetical protein FACS1894217_15170 [Clostridia bacterium]